MLVHLEPLPGLELGDKVLHRIRPVARRDQHGIGRRDDDDVVEPDHGRQQPVAVDQAVASLDDLDIAPQGIAASVLRRCVPECAPGADVRPGKCDRQDARHPGPLHDGVIDRDLGRLGEGLGIEAQEIEIRLRLVDGGARRRQHLGRMFLKLFRHDVGPEQEVAAVPQIALFHI